MINTVLFQNIRKNLSEMTCAQVLVGFLMIFAGVVAAVDLYLKNRNEKLPMERAQNEDIEIDAGLTMPNDCIYIDQSTGKDLMVSRRKQYNSRDLQSEENNRVRLSRVPIDYLDEYRQNTILSLLDDDSDSKTKASSSNTSMISLTKEDDELINQADFRLEVFQGR